MFLNTGKYLINSNDVYYILEKDDGGYIVESHKEHKVSSDNLSAIKTGLASESGFTTITNFGIVNLNNVKCFHYNEDTKVYRLEFSDRIDLILTPSKIADLDDTLFTAAKTGMLGSFESDEQNQ